MSKLKIYYKYFKAVVWHKVCVFQAGQLTETPIYRLLIHDWSKFLPSEFFAYAENFYGSPKDPIDFSRSWNHHQKRNKHHWQYWVVINSDGQTPVPMPEKYIHEMVADWLGASKAYEGKFPESVKGWEWFQQNINKINLHPHTRRTVIHIVGGLFDE